MPSPDRPTRHRRRGTSLRAALLVGALIAPRAAAAESPSPSPSAVADGSRWIISNPKIDRRTGPAPVSSSGGGWWIGTAAIAVALAAFGGISVASRRFLPRSETGPLRVVGRTSLSPKHSVYLLRAGDRVLIVGTGPQGSPTLLGEMPPEPPRDERPAPPRAATPAAARFSIGGEV